MCKVKDHEIDKNRFQGKNKETTRLTGVRSNRRQSVNSSFAFIFGGVRQRNVQRMKAARVFFFFNHKYHALALR